MPNSKIIYLYRDSANYKTYYEYIISGKLTKQDLQPYLLQQEFFIPSELGLKDL